MKNPSPRDWESDVIETFEREKVDALQAYKDKLRKGLAELREHNPFPDKIHSIVNLETGEMKPDPAYKQRGFMESGGYHSALDDALQLLDEGDS